jgi:RsiW-degrading membrane proteinase PrsW (M82 family)
VLETFLLAVILAPLVEESAKAWGVPRRNILEPEDGMIYGAAVGLGFAATENMLYLFSALTESVESFVATAVLRAVTSTLLHASATAVAGYGISRAIFFRKQGARESWLPYLALAMLIHALFNLFASLGDLVQTEEQVAFALIGLLLASSLALGAFLVIRGRIRALDALYPRTG